MNDLKEEYQARALLEKSKRFFKNGTQTFSSAKVTDQTECHKCGKKGHFTRDYWSKTSVPSYQSPFQPKLIHSFEHKPELRHTKDFEAKYNKVKAKLALLNSNASAPSSSLEKQQREVSITGSSKPKSSEGEDSTMSNHDTAPARGNKSSLASKTNSAPVGKLKNVKMEDDPPLAIVMKELNELKLKISKNNSSYFKNKNSQQYHTGQGESSSRSRPARLAIPFPSCIHYGYNDHKSDDCV
nr:hypothetical protein [Tanacetum cinerariifolium]